MKRYEISTYSFDVKNESSAFGEEVSYNFPLVLSERKVCEIAQIILQKLKCEMFKFRVFLPFGYYYLKVGDTLETEEKEILKIEHIKLDENHNVILEGSRALSFERSFESVNDESGNLPQVAQNLEKPKIKVLNIPIFENSVCVFIEGARNDLKLFYYLNEEIKSIIASREQVRGKIIFGSLNKNASGFLRDDSSYIEIYIQNHARTRNFFVNGINFAIIGGEICGFEKAVKLNEGHFKIESFFRYRGQNFYMEGFLENDFLLISEGNYRINFLNFTREIIFNLEGEETLNFPIISNVNKFVIGAKYYHFRKDGVFLWWQLGKHADFQNFDEEKIEGLLFEISFKEVNKKIITKGASFFISFEEQKEIWGKEIFNLEYYIKLL
jgi:hypothetical protein